MAKHRYLYSIIQKDGKDYPIDFEQWALEALSEEEYDLFKADMHELWDVKNKLKELGLLELKYITENFNTEYGETLEIIVGFESTFPDNTFDMLHLHDTFDPNTLLPYSCAKWYEKMSQDPRIIKFTNVEVIDN